MRNSNSNKFIAALMRARPVFSRRTLTRRHEYDRLHKLGRITGGGSTTVVVNDRVKVLASRIAADNREWNRTHPHDRRVTSIAKLRKQLRHSDLDFVEQFHKAA